MTYATLFRGGGGADHGLDAAGLQCLWQCEIDKVCNAVAAMFWNVPLVLDVRDLDAFMALPVPDVLWMSPPCQDLSVAGRRKGLNGERSGLFYDAIRVADHFRRRGTRFVLMEQVPGLLSSHAGEDFRAVLNSFLDIGARSLAWSVLDSQWFGLAQRRNRVFFVVDFGGEDAGEVLALADGLSWHPAPRRETGQKVADALTVGANQRSGTRAEVVEVAGCLGGGSEQRGYRNDLDGSGAFILLDVSHALTADMQRLDPTVETLIPTTAHALTADGFDASEGGTGRGTPIVPVCIKGAAIGRKDEAGPQRGDFREDQSFCLQTNEVHAVAFDTTQITSKANRSNPQWGDPCHPLVAQGDAPTILFTAKDHGADAGDVAPILRSMGHDGSHANGGGQPQCVKQGMEVWRLTPRECERLQGFPEDSTRWARLQSKPSMPAIPIEDVPAYWDFEEPGRLTELMCAGLLRRVGGTLYAKRVRFPDGKEASEVADGPRYKMLGNAVSSPLSRWLGLQVRAATAIEVPA